MKHLKIEYLLWLSLILALAGSLNHVAYMFASLDGNVFMGWIQAFGVELGIVALAYSVKERRKAKRSVALPNFGIVLFSVVSIFANLAYGFAHTLPELPRIVASALPYILAGTLPVLVVYLSHVVSDNRDFASAKVKQAERKAVAKVAKAEVRKVANVPKASELQDQLGVSPTVAERMTIILDNPTLSNAELAKMTGVAAQTIRNNKRQLNGRVKV